MIDNREVDEIVSILEDLEDETLAAELLQEFNKKASHYGKLILNQDSSLEHDQWKKLCDDALDELRKVVERIRTLS